MKQTIKRLMALLLAMAMSLSLLSANVWAAELDLPEDGAISAQSSESTEEEQEGEEESTLSGEEMPVEDGSNSAQSSESVEEEQEEDAASAQRSEETSVVDTAQNEENSVQEETNLDENEPVETDTDNGENEVHKEEESVSVSDSSTEAEAEESKNEELWETSEEAEESPSLSNGEEHFPKDEDLAPQSQSRDYNFNKSFSLGNDQASNLVAVASAQIGKTKAQLGYTEAWCADFVCDCARLTGMPDSIIPYNYSARGACTDLINKMENSCNAKRISSRQAGDIVFYYCKSCGRYVHTGIVLDSSYTIEGNYDGQVTKVSNSYTDSSGHTMSSGTIYRIYVRPNYSGNTSHQPQAHVDCASGGNGTIYVQGWAFDWDDTNTALGVHVYVGGPVGTGASGYSITANKSRPDVNTHYPGAGNNHGFEDTIEVKERGHQTLYFYAINVGGGDQNPLIGINEVDISDPPDTSKPTISDVRVTNVSSSSYTISCKVSDNVGVTSVRFPTWTVKNGQDDLGDWPIGTINNGVASYTVKSSEHKNETNCAYATHIYAYDAAGNATCVGVNEIWMMSPSKTIPDGRYHIGSKMNNSTTVTVGGESKAEGGNINLWNSYDTANQCFDISYLNNGYYKITNTNSGMALTADNGALTDGNVIQHSYTGSDDQQWAILNVGDGIYFELVPRANFLVRLDAQGAVPDNGTNIVVHTKNNYKNQRWCFAPWIPSTNVDYINGIVTFAGKELTEGIDYACERIANGVSITVKIIGKKPYASGMVSETLTDPFVVMLSQNYYFFDGTPKEPFTLVYIYGRLLENTRDYDVSYSNNVACGEATATIQFKGQYQGYNSRYEHERRVGFRIDRMPVSQCHVALSQNCLFFDGSQKRPSVIINNGNKELILNTDYTVSYGENTSPGTGTVKITGKGNYQGETIVGFSIQPSNLDDCTIDLSEKSYFYDGNPKLPAVTLKNGETPLIKGRDYEVSYQNNIQAGRASVLVTGKGGYTGTRGATFVIMPNRITDYVISLSEKTFIYDGAAKVPEVTIGNEEKTLNKGLDYEVSYRNNVNAGTATAIVIGKGIYSGKVEIPFTISKASNALSASMSNDSLHEKETAQITATGHGTIIYQSSDEGIATVNSSGVVTGKSVGTATIVVSAEDDPNYQPASKSVTITVTHDYDSGTVTQKATCTEDGMKTFTCRVCGKTNAEVIPAVGHSYEATVVPPTCTERGYTTHTCKNCNDIYEDSFTEALGHNFDNGEVTQEPTGDTPGVKTYVCSRCKATKTETIPAKGHHYDAGQVTEKASCTQDGIRTYTCTDAGCGKTYTEVIPATGHQYESVVTQPTCTKKGYTTHTCSVCTDSYRDNYVDALGHKYDNGTILEKPSCEEEGLKEFTCTRCKKASYTVVIPAAGHNYTEDTTAPTCTKKGYTTHTCSVCKSSYKDQFTDAIGHHFDEGKVVEEATCKEEGLVEYTCSKCKMTKTETIPVDKDHHTGSTQMKNRKEATCGKSGYSGDVYCNDCGKMIAEGKMISATEEHTWDDGIVFQEATCCSQGKKILTCSGCGYLKMEVLPIDSSNHVHTQIRGSRKATCVAAGYSGDTWCEDCNQKVSAGEEIAVDPSNHVGETEIRESKWATCAQEGYSGDTYCSSCGEKLSDGKTIPATGEHIWNIGDVTKAASCRSKGEKTFVCITCGATKSEEIPMDSSHHAGETEVKNAKAATCAAVGYSGDIWCKECGEKVADGESIPATGEHVWDAGTVTKDASCRENGEKTFTCTVCQETKTEEVPLNPANHTGGTEIRNRKTATCGKDGFTGDTYCLDCGEKLSSGQTTPATGKHIWDGGSVTTQPTTKTEGVKTYKCTVCGQTRTESVAKLPQPQPVPVVKVANTVTVKDMFFRTYNAKKDQTFNLGAKANGAPLSYKSSNKKVTVKNGKVTVKKGFMGQVIITVTAAETEKYLSTQKRITLMVGPSVTQLSSAKFDAKKKVVNAVWKKNTAGKGYEIQLSLKKDFKKVDKKVKINKNATIKTAIKGLKKGTYYVRIRTINGKAYSDWSKTKTVKVK